MIQILLGYSSQAVFLRITPTLDTPGGCFLNISQDTPPSLTAPGGRVLHSYQIMGKVLHSPQIMRRASLQYSDLAILTINRQINSCMFSFMVTNPSFLQPLPASGARICTNSRQLLAP